MFVGELQLIMVQIFYFPKDQHNTLNKNVLFMNEKRAMYHFKCNYCRESGMEALLKNADRPECSLTSQPDRDDKYNLI